MHTLINTPVCRECREVYARYDCQKDVKECTCFSGDEKCNCCKTCKYTISYPTVRSPVIIIDEMDLQFCSRCERLLTHVYKDGDVAGFSLTKLHKKVDLEPTSMDLLNIFSVDKRGYTTFCDDCVMGFEITNCSYRPRCQICKDVVARELKTFQFYDYHKRYNVCFSCKRFIEYIYTFPKNTIKSEPLEYKDFDIDNLHYVIKFKKYDICTITRVPQNSSNYEESDVAFYGSILHQFKRTIVIERHDSAVKGYSLCNRGDMD